MRFLVIQTAFIGDAILVSAVLEKLHQYYPDSRIDLLVRKGNDSLYKQHPYINRLLVWDKQNGKYRQMLRVIKKLRRVRYDYIFNFQRFATSGIMTVLARGKTKAGFRKNPLSRFFTHTFPHKIGYGTHETERNHQLIASVTDATPARPALYPSAKDDEAVAPYKNKPYVCIAPASVWFTKQLPPEKWLEVISLLKEKTVYLIGGPDDRTMAKHIQYQSAHPAIKTLCGSFTLLQTASLMRDAAMNYVNDSAPLHIATAMNAPVRAVFLSTVPDFGFTPLSVNSKIIESPESLPCRPCGLHGYSACPEGHFRCAYSIKPNQFID